MADSAETAWCGPTILYNPSLGNTQPTKSKSYLTQTTRAKLLRYGLTDSYSLGFDFKYFMFQIAACMQMSNRKVSVDPHW